MKLSLRRAEAARDVLVAKGVEASKISVAARGESEPAVPTADGVREQANRRVEIVARGVFVEQKGMAPPSGGAILFARFLLVLMEWLGPQGMRVLRIVLPTACAYLCEIAAPTRNRKAI